MFRVQRTARADPAAQDRETRPERSISFATQSLATVGAILVLAGSGVAISQRWLFVTNWGRVAVLAGVALCFLIAGFLVRWHTASATQPLTELMWGASAGCVAGAATVAAVGVYRQPAAVTVVIAGSSLALYAATLWVLCRREALMIAAMAGVVSALCAAGAVLVTDGALWLVVALGLWLIGIAWVILGWLYPDPLGTSLALGAALALVAPAIAVQHQGWVYVIGIATGLAAMAVSVPLQNVVLAAFGSCALFGYITVLVVRYADRSLGVPASLVIIGVALIGLAIITVRLGHASRPQTAPPKTPRPRQVHQADQAGRRHMRAA
jgi:hypothetical protein